MSTFGTCALCKKGGKGGVLTSGDIYNDGSHVGISPPPLAFYCSDCTKKHPEKIPNFEDEIDRAFAKKGLCGFLEAYVGHCRNSKPCDLHNEQKCWKCSKPATRNCTSSALSFVCGTPECAEHSHSETH